MPVKQLIKYYKDGQEIVWGTTANVVQVNEWAATLTAEEQAEFAAALARQNANRKASIDAGHLTSYIHEIIWNANSASAVTEIKSEPDPVWFAYWERWQSETGITVTETYTTV